MVKSKKNSKTKSFRIQKSKYFLVVIVLSVFVLLFFKNYRNTKNVFDQSELLPIDKREVKNVFVKGYPDFDNLTLDSFQTPKEIRNIFNYGDNLIIVDYNGVFEIDGKNNKL